MPAQQQPGLQHPTPPPQPPPSAASTPPSAAVDEGGATSTSLGAIGHRCLTGLGDARAAAADAARRQWGFSWPIGWAPRTSAATAAIVPGLIAALFPPDSERHYRYILVEPCSPARPEGNSPVPAEAGGGWRRLLRPGGTAQPLPGPVRAEAAGGRLA